MKKFVVFDLMGVIFKEGHIISGLLMPILGKHGIDKEYTEVKNAYKKYREGKIGPEEFHKLVPPNVEEEYLDSMELEERIFEIFEFLRENDYFLGVLSNVPKEWAYHLYEKYDLDKYFSIKVFSGEHKTVKPEERIYQIFLDKARTEPGNCYFVDDHLKNLEAAKELGFKTIWMKREEAKDDFIPDYKITEIVKLKKILA